MDCSLPGSSIHGIFQARGLEWGAVDFSINGHEFEQTPGDSEGEESLACCSPWGHKELDMGMTYQLNNKNNKEKLIDVRRLPEMR